MRKEVKMIKIAISATLEKGKITVSTDYGRSLCFAGAIPFILTPSDDENIILEIARSCSGLLLAGGGDVCPDIYGENVKCENGSYCRERDEFELSLFRAFHILKKPILGICRGHQIINVALGGTLFQDISGHTDISHTVSLQGKMLSLAQKETVKVNSYHHQAIKDLGRGLVVSAFSEDGVIEGVDLIEESFVRGVQFHPEKSFCYDEFSKKIISDFVRRARREK
jgi:putative glutamine amidotransferase